MHTTTMENPLVLSMTDDGDLVLFITIPGQTSVALVLEPAMAATLGASLINLSQKLLALQDDEPLDAVDESLN